MTSIAAPTTLHDGHDDEHPPVVIPSARMSVPLMGMLFFIGSEIMLFGSFFMAYFFLRVVGEADYSSWAHQIGTILPLDIVTFNSLILFSSSVTIHYAEIAVARAARAWQAIWLAATIVLGSVFLGIQILEYVNLINHDSIGPSTSSYSSVFFSLTGIHGTHVIVGLILLLVMFVRTLRGHYHPDPERHVGFHTMSTYWHFVDLIWIAVFGTIYVPGNWDRWSEAPIFFGGAVVVILLLNLPRFIGKGAPKHAK